MNEVRFPRNLSLTYKTPVAYTLELIKNRKYYKTKHSNTVILKALLIPSQRLAEEGDTRWVAINISNTSGKQLTDHV